MRSLYIADLRAQAYAEGKAEWEAKGIKESKLCFKYLKEGYSPAQIAAALGKDLYEIQETLHAVQEMIAI